MIKKAIITNVLIIMVIAFHTGCGSVSENESVKITVDINGTVDALEDPLGLLDSSVNVGTLIQGFYRLNPNTAPSDNSQPNSANYIDAIGQSDLEINIGNYSFRSSANKTTNLNIVDGGTNADGIFDGWYIYAQMPAIVPDVEGDFTIFISLYDGTASALSSTALIGAPNLNKWPTSRVGISRKVIDDQGVTTNSLFIAGELESLTLLE